MTHPACAVSQLINGYKLIGRLGAGSYGTVHLCESTAERKQYAIKIVDKRRLRKRRLGQSDEQLLHEVCRHPTDVPTSLTPTQGLTLLFRLIAGGGDEAVDP